MQMIFAALFALSICAAPALARDKEVLEAEHVSDAADKIICKRYPETGSLVRTVKVCGTKADWEKKRADLRYLAVTDACRLRSEGGC